MNDTIESTLNEKVKIIDADEDAVIIAKNIRKDGSIILNEDGFLADGVGMLMTKESMSENLVTLSIPTSSKTKNTIISTINLDTGKSEVQPGFERAMKTLEKKIKRGIQRRIRCNVCNETFSQMFALKEHVRVHTGEKPYVCPHCLKHFRHISNYQKHKAIHENEKKFLCDMCNKGFRRKCHIERHMLSVHKLDTKLQEKSASGKSSLTVVKTTPNPFSCKKCGKTCKTMSDMRKHWAWHCYAPPGSENPLKEPKSVIKVKTKYGKVVLSHFCTFCDKGYQFQSTLDVHMSAFHLVNPSVECVNCAKTFSNLYQLKRHLKTDHDTSMERVNSVLRDARAEEAKRKKIKLDKPVSDSLIRVCTEPIYEIESKDELLFLDAGDLEEECSVHNIPVTGLPNVMIHRIWQHYKASHKEDLEKVPELCNLLINYGDSVPFEIEQSSDTNIIVDNSIHHVGVGKAIETGNSSQNVSKETIIQVNEVVHVIQVDKYN